MANTWKNSFSILMEVNLLFFFILLIYIDGGALPSILGILLAFAVTIGIYTYLSAKLPSTYASIMLVAPIVAVVPFLFQYNVFVSLLIGFFLSFRGFMYFIEERRLSTFALLLNSFFWMPIIYVGAVATAYPFSNILLALFACQLVFVLLLYSGETLLSLKGNPVMQKRVLLTTGSVFSAIVATALLFSTFGKWIIAGVLSVFGSVLTVAISIITAPIMYLLGLHDWTPKTGMPEEEDDMSFWEVGEEEVTEAIVEQGSTNPFVLALLAIVFIVILYFLLKRKKVEKDEKVEAAKGSFMTTLSKKTGAFVFSKKSNKPPEDEVRRLMFDLEKLALKKKRGRLPYETLEDWLQRETFLNIEFLQLYRKVRYGEMTLSPDEIAKCKEMAQELRKILKQLKNAG